MPQAGICRLVHFPASEHEELVTAWLGSEQGGVISHQTALSLRGPSDGLPARVHITLPAAWRQRRLRVSVDVMLHHADVPAKERAWFSADPGTSPRRTLNDCANDGLTPDLLQQAAQQAVRRGLVTRAELRDVETALAPYGGLAASPRRRRGSTPSRRTSRRSCTRTRCRDGGLTRA